MAEQSRRQAREELATGDGWGIPDASSARGAESRRALVFAALCLVAVGILEVVADQARRQGLVSELAGDITQYAAVVAFGLVLIRTTGLVLGVQVVRNLLVAALLLIIASGVLNVTNDIDAFRTWPLLGIESRLNSVVKYACEIAALVLTLVAFVVATLLLKRARDELRQSERMLNATGNLGRIGGWEHDLATGKVVWTKPLYDIVEVPYDREPPRLEDYLDYYPPPYREMFEEAYGRAVKIGTPFDLELQASTATGKPIWCRVLGEPVYENGTCVGVRGTFQDVTELKRAEDSLREREGLYRQLIETTNSFVFTLDPNGIFHFVNRFWTEKVGFTAEEIVGINGFDLIDPEMREAVRERMPQVVQGSAVEDLEFRSKTKGGGFVDVLVNLTPMRDSSGEVSHILGTGVDITERRKAEAERAQLEEQYRQAQKMEAIGNLTGGVAHDFNNLLQVINAGAEMAMEDLEAGHPARESVADVAKAGERAARLVSQLLLFGRRQIIQPELLELNEVVADLLEMLRRVIGEHIQLRWVSGADVGTIRADRGMIEQALVNLCVNARDAMPDGGTLTIQTNEASLDEVYCAANPGTEPGRYAVLIVEDSGCGMDEATLDRIFEPFFTTKEIDKGTGLGLATVYGIVKQHGGVIRAFSEPRLGTTFRLYWPRADAQVTEFRSAAEGAVHGGSETILLAEDDEMVQQVARAILERAGYTVLTATDGIEAVALVEEHGERVEVAILDVVMPRMGGREAYEQMRRLRPDLKILFASGYSEDEIDTDFVLKRGLRLIQKPFAREALLRAVRAVLDQSTP